ncbi:Gfo/Idh/MocA family oxidoreductase [Rhizobium sp. TH2]|nr:Gfo/Idh/MocA family oxidoreductase [Rhizobium sp. TH2]UVC07257.1 Gfo/Idh/MocA family oxidoreductase [Rhizobium sp. TH2]
MQRTAVICGCGSMAKGWLKAIATNENLSDRAKIIGLVDLDVETARKLAEECSLGDVPLFTDLDAALTQLKPDLLFDIVIPVARRAVVEAGLRHGCHVLSEKPMANSIEDARHLIAKASEAGRIHAVVQNRRYIPGIRRLRAFIESGAIGELTGLHADFFIGAHFGGFREDMDNVLLLDMAIHTFDAARFVSGKVPEAVYCHETNPAGSWYRTGASAFAIFEMSDDVRFTYRGSWCAEGANTSWESQWRITGTKGTVMWDGKDLFDAHRVASDDGFLREQEEISVSGTVNVSETEGHASVIAAFLDGIDNGTAPETRAEDNIRSLAMVMGAIESARTGQRVMIREG